MSKIRLPEAYPYLYETHMHTARGSACSGSTGVEMAKAYKQAGYAGIIITEHNWGGNTAIWRRLPWNEWVGEFSRGYVEAAEWGRQNDLAVFWGYEAGYDGTEFLIYGLSPDFIAAHPELRHASVKEQYRIVKAAGGMVVHAHPYREAAYIPAIRLFPEAVDAVEGINAAHHNRLSGGEKKVYENKIIFNQRAVAYAKKNRLPLTAGSDMHHTTLFGGGMAFPEKLTDIQDFCRQVMAKKAKYLLTDGMVWYDRAGEPVEDVVWEEA